MITGNEPKPGRDDSSRNEAPEAGRRTPRSGHTDVRSPVGLTLGERYDVEEEIGSGAFAVTYRGRDARLGRAVAIKVLRQTYAINPISVQRFEREARAAASVAQGNVVDVYDFGRHGDLLYLVMQFIEGEDLKKLILREGPMPPRRAAGITFQVLAGLEAIHRAGIIHRDIKPQNVMIGRDGIARVADFGIARAAEDVGLTTTGSSIGTVSYMAPEQAQVEPLTPATDLYAVGVMLYEMLTGKLPFEAPTIVALMLAHIQTPPVPPSARAPDPSITPEVDAVVMRALAKRPEDRYADATAMAGALSAAIENDTHVKGELTRSLAAVQPDTLRTVVPPSSREAAASPRVTTPQVAPEGPVSRRRAPRRGDRALIGVLLLLLIAGGSLGGAALWQDLNNGNGTGDDQQALVVDLNPTSTPTITPAVTEPPMATITPLPTPTTTVTAPPTRTPVPSPTATAVPTETRVPTRTPEPTAVPTETPAPTRTPEPTAVPTETPVPTTVPEQSQAVTMTFTASDWEDAYFQETGNMQPWSAVYAQGTGYEQATLRFDVDGEPASENFTLSVDGMTSENWTALPIAIRINDVEVFSGNSPFPTWSGVDGEQPWATASVELPTSTLVRGENTITFINRNTTGNFSEPPYILLADATITVEVQADG